MYFLQVGDHRLEMTICGKKIDPYPLTISGYSAENVKIEPLGGGTPGQPVQFIGKIYIAVTKYKGVLR